MQSKKPQEGPERKILGLNKNIFLLGIVSLLNDFSSEMVFSVFPAFFTSVLKTGAASLGLVDGIAESFSNIFKIYSGRLSDRRQKRKPLVVLGYLISVATRPFYPLIPTVAGALGLRVTDRIGKGLRDAPRDAIVSLSSPPQEIGKSFGYHRAMDTTGAILGPLAAYVILSRFPMQFNAVFLTAFGIGLITLFTLIFIRDIAATAKPSKTDTILAFKQMPRQFKLFLASIFILSLGSLPVTVLLLKTESAGLVIASIPLFYVLYNLPYAGFSIAAGKASDKIGPRNIIIAGYVTLIIGYAILSLAHSALILGFAFLVLGFFPALTDGVQRAFASQVTSEESRGTAFGLLNAANGLGVLAAGAGGGYIWQTYSPGIALTAATGAIIAGLALFVASSPKQP
jgi:MFS family permease